jgi:hypothetical protein
MLQTRATAKNKYVISQAAMKHGIAKAQPFLMQRAARTAADDVAKKYAPYYRNRASLVNFTSKGILYIKELLQTMKGWGTFSPSKDKRDLDSLMADMSKQVATESIIPAMSQATVQVDSQAKKVYIEFEINTAIATTFDKVNQFSDLLKTLFESVNLPRTATLDENARSLANYAAKMQTKGFMPIDRWSQLQFPESVKELVSPHIRPLSKEYPKEIASIPELKLEYIDGNVQVYSRPENNIVDMTGKSVSLNFRITVRLVYPLAYAYWATYAKDPKSFSIPNFYQLISQQILGGSGRARADQSVDRLIPMQTSMDILQDRIKSLKLEEKPRINRNRMTILSTGEVLYIPENGDLTKYDSNIQQSYDVTTKKVTPLNKIPEIRDTYLLSDWIHNIAVYTNQSGHMETLSLIGAMPFEDRFVMRYFRQNSFEKAFNLKLDMFQNVADELFHKLNMSMETLFQEARKNNPDRNENPITTAYPSVVSLVGKVMYLLKIYDVNLLHLFDDELEAHKDFTGTELEQVDVFCQLCRAIFKSMFKTRTKYSIRTLMSMALPFYIFGVTTQYLPKYKRIFQEQEDKVKKDHVTTMDAISSTIDLPNLPGLTGMMPHQSKTYLTSLHKCPPLAAIDISAGGGKTGIGIIDILTLLEQGKIKRPLVLAPGKLVSEWVSEINKFSQGKINPYPLTSNSLRKLNRYLGYNRQKLLDVIRSAPVNTIFIASFSFLKVADPFKDTAASKMQYGGKVINFFPNTQFITQGGFDFVSMDESHKLKNVSSQLSEAARSVVGNMEYRRIMSGTILFNTVQDLEGQTALLNPAILTDMRRVIEQNADISESGKIQSVDPRLGEEIAKEMQPYVARLVYRRRDWAYQLPRINYGFLQCDMTENMQTYYNDKVDEQIAKMLDDDPKLRAILESGDQEKIDRLMSKLDTNFQRMEIFVNSPESEDIFRNLQTTDDHDLTPPKAKLVNELLGAHFNGGTVVDVTGTKIDIVKSRAKVIIFGYNRDTSKAMFKALDPRFRGRAVHYASGVKDAIVRFREDEDIHIIVADETSMREGLNLTMASMIIRLQALWTPGAEEQASSRILRADFGNKYGREQLYLIQIMCRNTLDIAKTARNISKRVSNLAVSEGERDDWKHFIKGTVLDGLEPITMNLQLLKNKGTVNSVGKYFNAFQKITEWDYRESKNITADLRDCVAKKTDTPVEEVDLSALREGSLNTVTSTHDLPNSKAIWAPLVPDAKILDKFGLELEPLAVKKVAEENDDDDDDDDDDNVELEDNVTYAVGDMVVTEFGFGYIRSFRYGRANSKNEGKITSVNVEIPGFDKYYPAKDYVNLSLLEVFKPTNSALTAKFQRRLDKLAEKGKGILFIEAGIAGMKTEDIISKVSPTDVKVLPGKKPGRPNVKPADHPGAKPENKDNKFDPNNFMRVNDEEDEAPPPVAKPPRQGKPAPTPPAPQKPAKPVNTTRKPQNDEEVKPRRNNGIPVPANLDDATRRQVVNKFLKDPNKLFHYQKQTDTVSAVVDLAVVNGQIAMCTYPDEENFEKLEQSTPGVWNKVGPMVFIKINTYKGAQNLIARLEDSYALLADAGDRLLKLAKSMQSKSRPQIEQHSKMDFTNLVRNFALINHKPSEYEDGLKFYPTVYDGHLYIIIPYNTQKRNANQVLKWQVTGCDKPRLNRTTSGYSFFRNKDQALRALNKIATQMHVVNYEECRDGLEHDPEFVNFVNR